jgi:hypothetical protein
MTAQITDELTDKAVRAVPMDDGFTTEGHSYQSAIGFVDLCCVACSWYAEHVAPRGAFDPKPVTGHVTRRTGVTPLADLTTAAQAHACPPEVAAAARAARAARSAATATAP